MLHLMTLCETGTRGLLGAVFGPASEYETAYARRLLPLLDETMLVLADRGFDADDFLADVATTGARMLVRITARRRPAVLAVLADGSYLTRFGGLALRVIDAVITMTSETGEQVREHYRLATTLLDAHQDPAERLVSLTTSGGRSSRPTTRCATPCKKDSYCGRRIALDSNRRCGGS